MLSSFSHITFAFVLESCVEGVYGVRGTVRRGRLVRLRVWDESKPTALTIGDASRNGCVPGSGYLVRIMNAFLGMIHCGL
jgi:hypothetical protein